MEKHLDPKHAEPPIAVDVVEAPDGVLTVIIGKRPPAEPDQLLDRPRRGPKRVVH